MRWGSAPAAALTLVAVWACDGPQNALATRGAAAERIEELWWVMLALAAAVCVAVAVLLALAVRSGRRRGAGRPTREVNGWPLVIAGGVAVPALIVFGVLTFSYRVGTEVYPGPDGPDPLVIEVVGHQFWWEVRYPQHGIVTANEIHVPVGRPVVFRVSSPDVIHSFWVPQLHGKIDMIPGRVHTLRVVADEPGRFRGQCAEFCGEAHALMSFWVEAHEPDGFAAWLDRRRVTGAAAAAGAARSGPQPGAAAAEAHPAGAAAGEEIFFAAGCGDCHAVPGAPLDPVQGETGPDLTDLAARATLAAATIPNTRATLRAWILAPDAIKPGALMPATTHLSIEEMDALLDYLETLR